MLHPENKAQQALETSIILRSPKYWDLQSNRISKILRSPKYWDLQNTRYRMFALKATVFNISRFPERGRHAEQQFAKDLLRGTYFAKQSQ
jgi:hypothetical protein